MADQGATVYCVLHYITLGFDGTEIDTMHAAKPRKDHPLSMRLPEADIALIDRAAQLRNRSRTDFVRDAAVRAAEEALMDNRLIRLSEADFALLMADLDAPPKIVPELVELFNRTPPWETDPGGR